MDRKSVGQIRESSKRTKGGVLASAIQLQDLRPFFSRSAEEASKKLGVGLTVLKRRCRELGVTRWPYRQIKCVEKLIEYISVGKEDDDKDLQEKLAQLRRYKESILNGRPSQLPLWAKRSQQHLSKLNYRAKVKKSSFDGDSEELELSENRKSKGASQNRATKKATSGKKMKAEIVEDGYSSESNVLAEAGHMDAFESCLPMELSTEDYGSWMSLELPMAEEPYEMQGAIDCHCPYRDTRWASRCSVAEDEVLPESSFLQGVYLEGIQAQDQRYNSWGNNNSHMHQTSLFLNRKRCRQQYHETFTLSHSLHPSFAPCPCQTAVSTGRGPLCKCPADRDGGGKRQAVMPVIDGFPYTSSTYDDPWCLDISTANPGHA